jgi:hypothetical protein
MAANTRNKVRLNLDTLECRVMMSATPTPSYDPSTMVLRIDGTSADNRI